jgi:hypothetical protein
MEEMQSTNDADKWRRLVFCILNREDREDRKENLFGSFSCRAVSLHLQSRWLQEAPQRGALGIGGIVAVPIGTG